MYDDDQNETAEKAFQWIERGNKCQQCGNFWAAAENYGRSVKILDRLSKEALEDISAICKIPSNKESLAKRVAANKKRQEQIKISELYEMKSNEYLIEGRKCFFKAITFENEQDEIRLLGPSKDNSCNNTDDKDGVPGETTISASKKDDNETNGTVSDMISDEEAQRRLGIFSCLYANNVINEEKKHNEQNATTSKNDKEEHVENQELEGNRHSNRDPKKNEGEKGTGGEKVDREIGGDDVGTKQNDIEARLQELNASLPSGFKTSKERMSDIDRGLRRLGLSLYSHQDEKRNSVLDSITQISDEEQIEQIMAQAKDEAMIEQRIAKQQSENSRKFSSQGHRIGDNLESDSDDSDENNDDDDEDDEASELDLYTTKINNRKLVRRMIAKAQVKLAKLSAIIEDKKSLDDVNNSENIMMDSENSDNDDSHDDVSELGRKTLLQARRSLDTALKEW